MKLSLIPVFLLITFSAFCQHTEQASIKVDARQKIAEINPFQYGQFIEHLGRAVNGGIYDEHSKLSDKDGFRKDVLEKVKELRTPLLRYPGGTFTKIYHWEDGIGPKALRKKRKNLIWGGLEDNHFGTAEFVTYCRKIGAEPFLVVNMATGTPEEAANWVEYCNGTGDTYYANLRRADGFDAPFNVKYWGIGNEEYAETDAGRHQDVNQYIKDTWQFVKLMKLQDNSLKLILVGNSEDMVWSTKVLEQLGPVCDLLSVHLYAIPPDTSFTSLIHSIDQLEKPLVQMESLLDKTPAKVEHFNAWYRFPSRKEPVKLAVDEWGIWDISSGKGKGAYQMEYQYNWSHALGVATFLNLFQRHSASIGMATWAQTVNVLAPIMTDAEGSYRQTVFTPLKAFRDYAGKYVLKADVAGPDVAPGIKALDITSSLSENGKQIILTIVNRDTLHMIKTAVEIDHLPAAFGIATLKQISFTGESLYAVNSFKQENAVKKTEVIKKINSNKMEVILSPASLTILILD
ncbi:alpha-L-arabinofuranosidase C-terminal domain-containing protein [Pedobacter sp. L105]|uniref:alpha-L-arabinofuranosidase C-terminal domain-containing protein n=1 Tax=Pedobacter sp. L105 TaxID=1641871 RepID=UPI00131B7F38|nr:alpha-L-arabinofuranosidase C-terminal domain-containing protein [Pedobacter sp. L105]